MARAPPAITRSPLAGLIEDDAASASMTAQGRRSHPLGQLLASREARQVTAMMFLAAVVLWNQIENEVFYSVDDVVYALVAKELTRKPLVEWVVLTWFQAPFYEHPHLTPWMLGVGMALFGVGTTAAIIPVVLLSTLTVLLTYCLGRSLIDHRYGLLAATTLALTPQFVKGGRNPMLEPALMFFIMLTIYCHLRAAESRQYSYTALMGLSLGLAVLAKGPPAVLAVAVIAAFQGMAWLFPDPFARFKAPRGWLVVHLVCAIVVSVALIALVDVWHHAVAGKSFFAQYFADQWKRTVLDRGQARDPSYYVKVFLQYWPWLPFMLAGIPLVVWKKDWAAVPALTLGGLVTGGTFLGFSLLTHKAFWYVAIHYVGSSLMAALTLRYVAPESWMQKRYAQCCVIGATAILCLSATFPSLFLHDPRPRETFFQRAASELGNRLEDKVLADCINVGPWRAPFLFRFHLGATRTHCDDHKATVKVVDERRTNVSDRGDYRVLYSRHPFSIIELISHR
jgi:4-amino-4-deoxy-L-arabinose transferase-like glycosyltransferase